MATITINKKELAELLGKNLQDRELKEKIPMLGVGFESIDKDNLIIEINPNRPDMLSMQGFARAFSSFLGVKKGLAKYSIKDSDYKVVIDKSVKDVRPYTACAVVKNLKFDDEKIREIIEVQEKLHATYGRNRKKFAIGIYPFEKINMPIYYIAKKPNDVKFKPLEFQRELTALQILNQHPAGKEYAHLLQGLEKFPFFIDSKNKVLSMPPIINSDDTGKISKKTKDVFIECSGFDYNILSKVINIIATSLTDMGGKIYNVKIVYPDKEISSPNLEPSKMKIDISYINNIIGEKLSEAKVKECLLKMGYDYKNKIAFIPAYRTDILHQIDLVEDIAIAYGYENLEPVVPTIATIGKESNLAYFKEKISNFLVGFSFLETSTFCITNKDVQTKLMDHKIGLIELSNALSEEYSCLRAWMIPSLMQVLQSNKHHEYPQNIFEIGTIFKENPKTETNAEENERLAVLFCSKDANFTQIKQILDALFNALGLKYSTEETDHQSFITGRVARVIVNDQKIAYMGEINPIVLNNFSLEMPVAALELNVTELFNIINSI